MQALPRKKNTEMATISFKLPGDYSFIRAQQINHDIGEKFELVNKLYEKVKKSSDSREKAACLTKVDDLYEDITASYKMLQNVINFI